MNRQKLIPIINRDYSRLMLFPFMLSTFCTVSQDAFKIAVKSTWK